ncbi:DEAD/DEAH box helicase [bacterium]|nr:DEAD/DEAH box helicase [bacterium]MCB1221662.1 DEAD/DEAH box helicase [bacterium]
MTPGSIVHCRNRDWVFMPADDPNLILLRPLSGVSDDVIGIRKDLMELVGYTLPTERIQPSSFALPSTTDISDAASTHLLYQAARLALREGANPFRSLGHISVRPRIYQFVPLLMALRLDLVRMFIADDVGIGKTVEALMIAREMFDRGEIRNFCVLCPPYLCEQWQAEITEKMNMEAVVIRSGTTNQLDRAKPATESIYAHYPVQVASIDFIKTDRNRHAFLQDCPDLVIVDEAHGSANSNDSSDNKHYRHKLLREISALSDRQRHLILLSATPHSGIESAFSSLLGLLNPKFESWQMASLSEDQRIELARHFVQRTRPDIKQDWDGEHCFPERDPSDETYELSAAYRKLFDKTYDFCSEIVESGQTLAKNMRRARFWGALALMRCAMSSPAAALATLESRHDKLDDSDDELEFRGYVFESSEMLTDDEQPLPPVDSAEATLGDSDRRKLRALGKLAKDLLDSKDDTKLNQCIKLTRELLDAGFNPIIWCRFIATAEYVGNALRKELSKGMSDVQVVPITSRMGDDERQAKIQEINGDLPRVLVSTDCLSEGINLQHVFDAVLHYDLPWNPNRLEQREGRVDRFNQPSPVVKSIRYYSPENPVDGVVLEVLLNKARTIHKALGTYVPVPEESQSVFEALLNSLFLRGKRDQNNQLRLDLDDDEIQMKHQLQARWDRDVERERVNRSRFAQRALKPAEVRSELESIDEVLGDSDAVRQFMLAAAQRLDLQISKAGNKDVYNVAVASTAIATVPPAISFALPSLKSGKWKITFSSPTPEGAEDAEYIGRNHKLVAAISRYLIEEALAENGNPAVSRCGVIRSRGVSNRTTILLLRIRYLLKKPDSHVQISEEVLVMGYEGSKPSQPKWLPDSESLRLLAEALPDANIPLNEKQALLSPVLDNWSELESAIAPKIQERAAALEAAHKRVRQAASQIVRGLKVEAQLPPDLLGVVVIDPLGAK